MTCNDVDEYVIYTLFTDDGGSTNIRTQQSPFQVSFESDRLLIEDVAGDFKMDFNPDTGEQFSDLGPYEIDSNFTFEHNIGQPPYVIWRLNLGSEFAVIQNEITLNFIEIGEVGEYIIFTFEGQHAYIYDGNFGFGQIITNGTVRVRRDQ